MATPIELRQAAFSVPTPTYFTDADERQPTEVQTIVAADITTRLRHAQRRRALVSTGAIGLRLCFPGTIDYGMGQEVPRVFLDPVPVFQRKLGDTRRE
jgi:hypothetical protein